MITDKFFFLAKLDSVVKEALSQVHEVSLTRHTHRTQFLIVCVPCVFRNLL